MEAVMISLGALRSLPRAIGGCDRLRGVSDPTPRPPLPVPRAVPGGSLTPGCTAP
jgi:hypothetical protein